MLRGVVANWQQQGLDGVQTFNWMHASERTMTSADHQPAILQTEAHWPTHLQAYKEIGGGWE